MSRFLVTITAMVDGFSDDEDETISGIMSDLRHTRVVDFFNPSIKLEPVKKVKTQ